MRDVTTDVVDLTDVTFGDLRRLDWADLADTAKHIGEQVERPRTNLGGDGPPGRSD